MLTAFNLLRNSPSKTYYEASKTRRAKTGRSKAISIITGNVPTPDGLNLKMREGYKPISIRTQPQFARTLWICSRHKNIPGGRLCFQPYVLTLHCHELNSPLRLNPSYFV
jgi:hypothetical protein